jgi:hypothetical protein
MHVFALQGLKDVKHLALPNCNMQISTWGGPTPTAPTAIVAIVAAIVRTAIASLCIPVGSTPIPFEELLNFPKLEELYCIDVHGTCGDDDGFDGWYYGHGKIGLQIMKMSRIEGVD